MRVNPISDRDLLRQYLQGNQAAFSTLLSRHRERIFSSIYFLVRDQELAEDIFQDTFIKIIIKVREGKYREEDKFLPWAVCIAHNLVIDYFRKEKQMPKLRDGEEYSVFDRMSSREKNAHESMVEEQRHQTVREMIKQLPDEQREVLIMRIYGELSFKEIAQITGVSINTALGRMRYALIHLRNIMEKKGIASYI